MNVSYNIKRMLPHFVCAHGLLIIVYAYSKIDIEKVIIINKLILFQVNAH